MFSYQYFCVVLSLHEHDSLVLGEVRVVDQGQALGRVLLVRLEKIRRKLARTEPDF